MSSTSKILILQSSDNEEFTVNEKAASLSQTIKNMVDDDCSSGTIPLHNVNAVTLSMVISYCNKHAPSEEEKEDANSKDKKSELEAFDKEYVKDLERDLLFDLIQAANYLNIPGLMDILCNRAAHMLMELPNIEDKRELLGIENDFTPEEEAEIRKEDPHVWE